MKTLKKTVSAAVAALALAGLFSVIHVTSAFASETGGGTGTLAVRPIPKSESAETDFVELPENMQKLYRTAIKHYKNNIRKILTKHTDPEQVNAPMLEIEELFVEYTKYFDENLSSWKRTTHNLEDLLKGEALVKLLAHYKEKRDNLDGVSWNADWSIDPKLIFSDD
ncbi:hypothetical protein [Streptococcus halichoeri]|uniref:hypothetical protein n=1 Tax=Streptococcus halichoeri TaxID=254785 RepID=UPI0013599254|nr:hypothetical protein [Streptococcus halichoeri]